MRRAARHFLSYALGSAYGAQLSGPHGRRASMDMPAVASGDLAPVRRWRGRERITGATAA
ncbi:MAG: hypothetical protein ACLTSG_12115 [Lachnospiraceae bacterium]